MNNVLQGGVLTPGSVNYGASVSSTNTNSQNNTIDYERMADANVRAFQKNPVVATMGRFENTYAITYNNNNTNLNNIEA